MVLELFVCPNADGCPKALFMEPNMVIVGSIAAQERELSLADPTTISIPISISVSEREKRRNC